MICKQYLKCLFRFYKVRNGTVKAMQKQAIARFNGIGGHFENSLLLASNDSGTLFWNVNIEHFSSCSKIFSFLLFQRFSIFLILADNHWLEICIDSQFAPAALFPPVPFCLNEILVAAFGIGHLKRPHNCELLIWTAWVGTIRVTLIFSYENEQSDALSPNLSTGMSRFDFVRDAVKETLENWFRLPGTDFSLFVQLHRNKDCN